MYGCALIMGNYLNASSKYHLLDSPCVSPSLQVSVPRKLEIESLQNFLSEVAREDLESLNLAEMVGKSVFSEKQLSQIGCVLHLKECEKLSEQKIVFERKMSFEREPLPLSIEDTFQQ